MNILLFHSDIERLQLLAFCLESQLKYNVSQVSNLEDAMTFLLGANPVDLLVVGPTEESNSLFKFLVSSNGRIPIIHLQKPADADSFFPELNFVGKFKEVEAPEKLLEVIKKKFPRGAPTEDTEGDLVRININLLLRVVPLKGDVFIRISSLKHVKLFKAGTIFTQDDLTRVWGVKKLDYLFILKSDAPEFMKKFQEDLTIIAGSAEPDNPIYVEQMSEAQETIQNLTRQVGFTPEVASLTKTAVSATLKLIGNSPKLSSLVFSALQKKNYMSGHSVLLAQIACYIASKLNWPSESTYHKLVLASFLHDITVADVELAKTRTRADLDKMALQLSPEELDALKSHPYSAGDILNKIPEVPSDVFTIVIQHHERSDGTGFPRGLLGHQIAPLAAVFIMAEDAVDYIFSQDDKVDIAQYFHTQLPDYPNGTFKKIARTLKDVI